MWQQLGVLINYNNHFAAEDFTWCCDSGKGSQEVRSGHFRRDRGFGGSLAAPVPWVGSSTFGGGVVSRSFQHKLWLTGWNLVQQNYLQTQWIALESLYHVIASLVRLETYPFLATLRHSMWRRFTIEGGISFSLFPLISRICNVVSSNKTRKSKYRVYQK